MNAAASLVLGPLWHVGIVVADLEAAMAELSSTHGHTWTSMQDQDVVVDVAGHPQCSRVRWVASTSEAPEWELIEARDGIWSLEHNNRQPLHHLAYWSDDLDADVQRLEGVGHTVEARGQDTDGRLRFVYLLSPSAIRIELGARYTQPAWDEWVGGGKYGLGIA